VLLNVALVPLKAPAKVTDPVILTDPVNTCVLSNNDPNLVDPVTKSTDEVIVCTTNVCAVNVFLTVKASADEAVCACIVNEALVALNAYEDVVAFNAYEALVALNAYDAVVALTAYEALVALEANDAVVALTAYEALVALEANDAVVAFTAYDADKAFDPEITPVVVIAPEALICISIVLPCIREMSPLSATLTAFCKYPVLRVLPILYYVVAF
jgi:hypothetical protein